MENELDIQMKNFFDHEVVDIKIYLIFRNVEDETAEYIYSSNYFGFGNKDYKNFKKDYQDRLLKIADQKEIVDYNISVSEDGTIEKIMSEHIPNLTKIKETLSPGESKLISDDKDLKPVEIWGYSVVLKNTKDESIRTFRKQVNAKLLQENKVLGFRNGEVNIIESDKRLILDFKVDAVEIKNTCYINNKFYFNQIFSYKEAHIDYAKSNFAELQKIDIMSNFDEFHERCIKSDNLVKRLVSVIRENRLSWLKENFVAAKKVALDYNLKIDFDDKEEKIIYSEKTCNVSDVITLIRGGCVRDAVDMERYIASSVRKVKEN